MSRSSIMVIMEKLLNIVIFHRLSGLVHYVG